MIELTGVVNHMPRSPTMIRVNPQVFFWLIDKSGWKLSEIADEIETDESEISTWKAKTDNIVIPISKVETISKLIKRPLSAFFLPEPPIDLKLPKDFRKLPDASTEESPAFTRETLLAFRKASHLQEVSQNLLKNLNAPILSKIPKKSLSNNPEAIGVVEREKTGFTIEMQIGLPNPTAMFEVLRDWLGRQEIYVFQYDFPLEDARGFALIESDPKIIVISRNDAIKGKIFTLIHEYAHILLHESAICNLDSDNSSNTEIARIENWCNRFAASFLFPKEKASEEFAGYDPTKVDFLKFLEYLSKKYKLSSSSLLVRFRFLDKIDYPFYIATKDRIESIFRAEKTKANEDRAALKAKGLEVPFAPKKPKDKSIYDDRGSNFVSLVLENSNKGYITERDVMDILELKVNHLVKLLPP
ncbi:MAG: ImmA/IrrE family metallo-endopeptidase [Methanoregula sp.]|nr:ImmA/IrrE family metallo-endopeptidase [Methanoregula sp.]